MGDLLTPLYQGGSCEELLAPMLAGEVRELVPIYVNSMVVIPKDAVVSLP